VVAALNVAALNVAALNVAPDGDQRESSHG